MRNTGSTSGVRNAITQDNRERENREARRQELNDSAHPNRVTLAEVQRSR
jgi:hypothetical protein